MHAVSPGAWFSQKDVDGRFAASLRNSPNAQRRPAVDLARTASLDGTFYPPRELEARYVSDAKALRTSYDRSEELKQLYASLREASHRKTREAMASKLRHADRRRHDLAAMHHLRHDLLRGLSAWCASARERSALAAACRACSERIPRMRIGHAWSLWAEVTAAHRHHSMRRALAHLISRNLVKGWGQWHQLWAEARRRRALGRRSLAHALNRRLSLGWNGMLDGAGRRKAATARLARAVAYMRHRKAAEGFLGWLEAHAEARRALWVARRGLESEMFGGRLRALRRWAEACEERLRSKAMLRWADARMRHRGLAAGWRQWAEVAAQRAVAYSRLASSVRRMRQRTLVSGFNAWADAARAARAAIARIVGSFLGSGGLGRAWRTWRCACDSASRRWDVAQRVVARWRLRETWAAFHRWVLCMAERAEAVSLLYRSLSMMLSRAVARGWHSWREAQREGSRRARRDAIASLALRRLWHRGLWRGWQVWHARWRRVANARSALQFWRCGGLVRAWARWISIVCARGAALLLLRRGQGFRSRRQLADGWRGWKAHQTAAKGEEHMRMERGLGHFLNRELSRGWNGWRAMVDARHAALAQVYKAVSYLVNRRLALGWRGWLDTYEERLRKLAGMKLALSLFVHREEARGWRGWLAAHEELQRRRWLARRSVLHMLHRELSRGWGGWVEMVDERREALAVLRRGLGFWLHRKLARGWGGWHDLLRHRAWQLGLLRQAAKAFVDRWLLRGWNGWVDAWRAERQRLAQLSRLSNLQLARRIAKMRAGPPLRSIGPPGWHRELARSAAKPLPRPAPPSEFLAKNVTEARRVRAVAEVEENRKLEARVRARSAGRLRHASSVPSLGGVGADGWLAQSNVMDEGGSPQPWGPWDKVEPDQEMEPSPRSSAAAIQGAMRPRAAWGLAQSASSAALPR